MAMTRSDEIHDILTGDLTVAVSYGTPAGGAVVTAVSPARRRRPRSRHEGRPEAPQLAWRGIADRNSPGFGLSRANFYQPFASLSLAKGQLTAAGQLIEAARAEVPPLDHVLEVSPASIDLVLGDVDTARAGSRERSTGHGTTASSSGPTCC
jgi:hypothetical protein